MNTPFTLALFSPGEAEKITGLSTTMQRDWRHRGFLPKNDGHARFDLFTLAMMMVLKLFADRNFGPQAVKTIADITARAIAWHALEFVDSFEGDIPDAPDIARRALWSSLGFPRLIPPRFLVVFADESEWWDNSLDHAFAKNDGAEKRSGPIIVLDMMTLGDLLADRAGRAFVHIDTEPDTILNPDRPS